MEGGMPTPLVVVLALVVAAPALAIDRPLEGDVLLLRDPAGNPTKRKVKFTAKRDANVDLPLAANPTQVGATLEVMGDGAGDGATGELSLDADKWIGLGNPAGAKGWRYIDPDSTAGIKKIVIKDGNSGGTITISGGKASWPYAVTQPQGTITLRFVVGTDVYCAEFSANALLENTAGTVKGKAAPAPLDCGTPTSCGDGAVQVPEECDDGDTDSGDGCSATCQLENTSALCAGVSSVSGSGLDAVLVASGLDQPIHVTAPRLDTRRIFITEQPGTIRIMRDGVLLPTPFLDIEGRVRNTGNEQGLFSVAFHPDYETNGLFYVNYTREPDGATVVSSFEVTGNPEIADEDSEDILRVIPQDFENHNGGQIAFDAAGFLYVGMGDGGSGGDPNERAQDDGELLGKMLRIDVDALTPDPLDEIFAKGLRNPFRFSFDRANGDLYIGDVGQNAIEEIDYQAAPLAADVNWGWDVFEGNACFDPPPHYDSCAEATPDVTFPVLTYTHSAGCSVAGGFVYRGCAMPDVRGRYFYSDFCSAWIRSITVTGGVASGVTDHTSDLESTGVSIDLVTSFGEDARGEIYICDRGGEVFRIVHDD
jgi:cysteine-rich repeat protein